MTTTTIRRAATQKNMGKKAAYDLALAAAMEGKRLVDEVKDWVGKQVRRAKRRERALIAAEKSALSK